MGRQMMTEELDNLRKFKSWVHEYLDNKGVPSNPDPEGNKQHGCRISGRMDYVFDEIKQLRLRLLSAAGDDLCRLTQEEIKAYTSGAVQIPPREEFILSCERFWMQTATGPGVLNGCLTLAQLISENENLRAEVERLKCDK